MKNHTKSHNHAYKCLFLGGLYSWGNGSNPAAATKLKSAMQLFWEMAVKTRNFVAKFMKTCQGTLNVL